MPLARESRMSRREAVCWSCDLSRAGRAAYAIQRAAGHSCLPSVLAGGTEPPSLPVATWRGITRRIRVQRRMPFGGQRWMGSRKASVSRYGPHRRAIKCKAGQPSGVEIVRRDFVRDCIQTDGMETQASSPGTLAELLELTHEQGTHLVLPFKLGDRKSTRLNSSHQLISYAVFCLKKKK